MRSPLAGFKDGTTRRRDERIHRWLDLAAHSVEGLGHVVRPMAGHIFSECRAVQLASRTAGAARETFGSFEDVIGNRDSGPHTKGSMTRRGRNAREVDFCAQTTSDKVSYVCY